MKKKTQEIVTAAIVTLLVVTLLGGFIISYLTSASPILFSDSKCDSYLSGSNEEYNFQLQNRAEVTALATVCFHVDKAYFENNGNLVHDYCFSESKISPKNSELLHNFNPKIVLDKSDLKDGENVTVDISVGCSQKIWSLGRRACDGLSYKCTYKKEHSSYRLVN